MQQMNNIEDMDTFRPNLSTIAADISSPGNSEQATDQETKGLDLFFFFCVVRTDLDFL